MSLTEHIAIEPTKPIPTAAPMPPPYRLYMAVVTNALNTMWAGCRT
ncbi:unnamed protein product, partial [marine sediment metagenome]